MTTEISTELQAAAGEAGLELGQMAAPVAATPELLALQSTNPIHFEMMTRLAQLEEALLARDPMMKAHLGAIHKAMIAHEELVHLLSDEQIGKIVAAQQVHTNTSLVAELSSKAGKAKAAARVAKVTLDDL